MAEISPDITLFHILPKLPVKSLRRFQCVSKQWLSFISTPEFAKMQLHHVITNQLQDDNHHKLLVFPSRPPYNFRIIDCENPKQNSSNTGSRPFPFEVRYFQYLLILTTFQGMVCGLGIVNTSLAIYFHLILWNPSTGEYKTLPKLNPHKYYDFSEDLFRLYYSSSDDDYKLLCVTPDPVNVYIYSLKSDSWRKIQSTETFPAIDNNFSYLKQSIFLNEKLYFLGLFNEGNYSVIRFDTKTEKLTQIATPFYQNKVCVSFMVIRGGIHLLATIFLSKYERCDELWRMNEDKDGDWTKVETISGFSMSQKPLHLMRNGNWLVRSSTCGNIYQVNLKKKKNNKRRLCLLKSSDILIKARYMETLVSPNQYMMK